MTIEDQYKKLIERLLELPAACYKDDDVIENVKRRKEAEEFLKKVKLNEI